jgi:hypothetical protein
VDHVVNRANELGLVLGLVTAKSWHVNAHPEKVFAAPSWPCRPAGYGASDCYPGGTDSRWTHQPFLDAQRPLRLSLPRCGPGVLRR